MKTTIAVVRILLGLIFTVFGLNGFLHFLPMPPMPQPAIDFFGALAATGYMIRLIFFGQLIGGVLLLTGIAVPLALVILAPIVVNILFFHLFLAPGGLAIAFVVVAMEVFLAWRYQDAFAPLFSSGAAS
jgi:putative oxidoreductase